MRRTPVLSALLLLAVAVTLVSQQPKTDPRLKHAYREAGRNGWIQVHLEGRPGEIGFQHGYLLAPEIQDTFHDISTEMTHDEKRDWEFFRKTAREVFWPHVEAEYREELTGIVAGLKARDVNLDIWDIVALNAWLELPYYDKAFPADSGAPGAGPGDHCSAFVATGSYTKDGRIVIGHNNWTSYASGERWNIIFDIVPAKGNRILMDGMAGLIHSGDDFGLNSAGIVITETTISNFKGFDPRGVPEFVRARKAMQYARSIDDFARIMEDGNNGGYANNWLVADRKNNEIADLELGLKNVTLQRTKDGFFVGSNFPVNPKLAKEETDFDLNDRGSSQIARRERWLALMAQYKGKIDAAVGEKFLADHYDSFEGKVDPSERTLDGHIELSPRGMGSWQAPYAPAGAVQNKVTDGAGAEKMSLYAYLGHACGMDFKAAPYLAKHTDFGWYKPVLHDMDARGWTRFAAGAAPSDPAPFKLEKTIPLPGVEGRFDHFAVDLAGKRLFVAALGNNTVEALDIAAAKRAGSVPGMHEPQGIAFAPDARKIYVANGQDGTLRILDAATLKPAGEVAFGGDADNVRYDAAHNRIWVGYGDGALGELDIATAKRTGDVRVDAHPESFQSEKGGTRIFVNVPNAGEIEVLDRVKKTVVAKWPVKSAAGANFPMALDEADHRLFTGCRRPAKVLVLDTATGRIVAQFPCPGDTDDLFYDAARKRLYVAGGEGFIEAFEQRSPDEYRSLGRVATAPGARTAFYVPELSRLFLAVPHRGAQGAEIRVYAVE